MPVEDLAVELAGVLGWGPSSQETITGLSLPEGVRLSERHFHDGEAFLVAVLPPPPLSISILPSSPSVFA